MRISFVGDIMCEKPLQQEMNRGNRNIFFNLKNYYHSNYIIGNLETVFAGEKKKYTRDIYSFNTPDNFCRELKKAKIDCVTTANNHCLDRGIEGLKRTIDILDKNGIQHVGTRKTNKRKSYLVIEIEGKKVGILSYTYGTNFSLNKVKLEKGDCYVNLLKDNSINAVIPTRFISKLKEKILSKETRVKIKKGLGLTYNHVRTDDIQENDFDPFFLKAIADDIQKIKKEADYVFAYLHTGGQFNLVPGDYSKRICNFFYNQGVRYVIASHPHVVQKIEHFNNGIIAYSLGNFLISPNSVYLLHENKPDVSIILHFDFNEKNVRVSFSIVKICFIQHHTFVRDCYELYHNFDNIDKREIWEECKQIFDVVSNSKQDFKMKKEYFLTEFVV